MPTSNEVAEMVAKTEKPKTLQELILAAASKLKRALPKHMSEERLQSIAFTCLRTNPELTRCTAESFLGALFTAAQIGIEPIAGRAFLLPFNNSRKINGEWKTFKEVGFVIGYKGIVELFYRHAKAVMINWGVVHANDRFEYEYGSNHFLRHVPAMKDRGEVIAFWVMAQLKEGGNAFMVMSREDCIKHGMEYSKTYDKKAGKFYDSSPWINSEESMCLKTVLIQLSKILPLSVEIQRAIERDETSIDLRPGIEPLDTQVTTEWQDQPKTESTQPETVK